MKLAVLNAQGKQLRQITVDDSVFGIAPNAAVLHQAFVAQRANQRRGTARTKSRGEVQGSTRKIRGQKYTGRARQGSNRSPVRVGGGAAFGPKPRSYRQAMPKKMRRLAIRSALSGKVADGQLHVVDKLGFEQPQTKEVIRILQNAGIERSALVVTGGPDRSVLLSARNRPRTKVLPAGHLNVVDMLTHRDLLLTEDAVRAVEGLWGAAPAPKPDVAEPPKRRRARAAAEAPAADAEAPVEEKPRRRRASAAAEAPAEEKPRRRRASAAAEAPAEEKPRRRRASAAPEAPAEEKPRRRRASAAPEAPAEEKPSAKPARRSRAAKADSPDEKPARASRRPKAEAETEASKPARRRPRAKEEE